MLYSYHQLETPPNSLHIPEGTLGIDLVGIDLGDFDKDRCEGLKTGSFTSKVFRDIPGRGSQKGYKTVILDLKLCIWK